MKYYKNNTNQSQIFMIIINRSLSTFNLQGVLALS